MRMGHAFLWLWMTLVLFGAVLALWSSPLNVGIK